jgi:hypothetical protein
MSGNIYNCLMSNHNKPCLKYNRHDPVCHAHAKSNKYVKDNIIGQNYCIPRVGQGCCTSQTGPSCPPDGPSDIPPNTTAWNIRGNAGTAPPINFVGTTDSNNFLIATNNNPHTRFDINGQIQPFGANGNVFLGINAGLNYVLANGDLNNTFIGQAAGQANAT